MGASAVETLAIRIDKVINLYRNDKNITIAEIIGTLEVIKLDLYQELQELADEDDDY